MTNQYSTRILQESGSVNKTLLTSQENSNRLRVELLEEQYS